MRNRVTIAPYLVALIFTVTACDQNSSPVDPTRRSLTALPIQPLSKAVATDSLFSYLATQIRGFGGFYFDREGNTVVHLVDPAQQGAAEAAVRAVLSNRKVVVGPPNAPRVAPAVFAFRTVTYDFLQLTRWKEQVSQQAMPLRGVIFTDADEVQNRVVIGITDEAIRGEVLSMVDQLGIPSDAVMVEKTGPFVGTSHSLRDRFDYVPGGVEVYSELRSGTCTAGFNATFAFRFGVYFMTNSHCTLYGAAGSNNDLFYQPSSGFNAAVGHEAIDPPYFQGGYCPDGNQCRWSDAAAVLYEYRGYDFGKIARTENPRGGSIFIDSSNPRLQISDVGLYPFVGELLDKIGSETGWTAGYVTHTCRSMAPDTPLLIPSVVLLCQDIADYRLAQGDSGAPVFSWGFGNTVVLLGIHWGVGTSDPYVGKGVFSSMDMIRRDFSSSGSMTVF